MIDEDKNQAQPAGSPSVTPPRTDGMATAAPTDGEQASLEEQAQYEQFVAQAQTMVYDEAMLPKIIGMLKGTDDPVEGLAQTAAMVIGRVAGAAEKAGEQLTGDVVMAAGTEVFEDLANLATKAGVYDFENDPDAMEAAYFKGLDHFRTMLQDAGEIDQAAAQQDMARLQEMDQSGELETMFRKLAGERKPEPSGPMAGGIGGAMEAAR